MSSEGIESKLVGFAQDAAKFDRLLFDTGKSTLNKAGSQAQLENMVVILKAFPNVRLKVGGYTDNTGNKDANMQLSAGRAENRRIAVRVTKK